MKKIDPYFVTGFTEGEGSFYVGIFVRKKMNIGWEIIPSYSISQNKRDEKLLQSIASFFNCGFIRYSKKDNMLKYEVRSLDDIIKNIIPHFQKYLLRSEKKKDFKLFMKIVFLMKDKKHLSVEGFQEITRTVIKMTSNPKRIQSLKRIIHH